MTNQSFELGDIVQIKSGGPGMTIYNFSTSRTGGVTAWCRWFDGIQLQEKSFPVVVLKSA